MWWAVEVSVRTATTNNAGDITNTYNLFLYISGSRRKIAYNSY